MEKKKPRVKRSPIITNHYKRRGCQYFYDGRMHRKPQTNLNVMRDTIIDSVLQDMEQDEPKYIREEETSIAKVRNKLSPIVNYFAMRKLLDTNDESIQHCKNDIVDLIEEQYTFIQNINMDELLLLIRNDDIWI